jgi:hypothetical protein
MEASRRQARLHVTSEEDDLVVAERSTDQADTDAGQLLDALCRQFGIQRCVET